MTYEEALEYIASLAPRGWRLGLDRMEEFVRRAGLTDALGDPSGPQFIHVAGTNGKGSVTAFLQSMLCESGYLAGAFFSPYVYDPRERVQICGVLIPKDLLATLTERLRPIGESLSETEFGGVTEFEFKTALGFAFWKVTECQWVALEVGLGGRLDATNVVTPRASVIVSIGLDHVSILGDTLASIAAEKAGIIKPGIPVVVGSVPSEALEVILARAAELAAPIWRFGHEIRVFADARPGEFIVETPVSQHGGLKVGLPGAMQGHNMALAVAAMDAARATRTLNGMMRGAARARIPGRFEVVRYEGRTLVLDGAHNAEAAVVLRESLAAHLWTQPDDDVKRDRPIVLVTGMVQGHDPSRFYRELASVVRSAHTAPIDFHRGISPEAVGAAAREAGIPASSHATLSEALKAAMDEAGPDGLVVVTGSFYLVGEAGRLIGLGQRRGPIPE